MAEQYVQMVPTGGQMPDKDMRVQIYPCFAFQVHIPLVEIGKLFGGRDHSTVIHAINKVEDDMAADATFGARVQAIRAELMN